jgi:hypothetical protein
LQNSAAGLGAVEQTPLSHFFVMHTAGVPGQSVGARQSTHWPFALQNFVRFGPHLLPGMHIETGSCATSRGASDRSAVAPSRASLLEASIVGLLPPLPAAPPDPEPDPELEPPPAPPTVPVPAVTVSTAPPAPEVADDDVVGPAVALTDDVELLDIVADVDAVVPPSADSPEVNSSPPHATSTNSTHQATPRARIFTPSG